MIRLCHIGFVAACLGLTPASVAAKCNADLPTSTATTDFVIHGDGTATHKFTGLVWKTCVEGRSGKNCAEGKALDLSWQDAIARATAADAGGFSDWRVPNIKELQSLVDASCFNPGINETVFPNTPGSWFWSATSLAVAPSEVWGIGFGAGYVMVKNKQKQPGHVRLVRGGLAEGGFDSQAK